MRTFKIAVTEKATGASSEISADFEDEEVVSLEGFVNNAHRLMEARVIKEGLSGSLTINYDRAHGLSVRVRLPDEDLILAFLHRLRRFILNDEPSSYNKVTGIIARRFDDPFIRGIVRAQRALYEGRDFQSQVRIESNATLINCDDMLMKWLNAFEFHTDATKQAEIEKLHQLMPLEASRAIFIMILIEKVKAIANIANFIELLMGRVQSIETTSRPKEGKPPSS